MPYKDKKKQLAYNRDYSKKHYKKNRKRIDARLAKWRKDNPKKCAIYRARTYKKNWKKRQAERKAYYKKNRTKLIADKIAYNKRNPLACRRAHYKIKYGITLEDYNRMFKNQKGKCAICGITDSKAKIRWQRMLGIDHNHKTGKIRGLLCNGCNSGLGSFEDNVKLLRKAVRYLV